MPLKDLDHYNIDTTDPEATRHFYVDVLGCKDGSHIRPDFGSPGIWFLVNDRPVVHVNYVDPADANHRPGDPTGAFNHVAFEAADFAGMCQRLDTNGVTYRSVVHNHIDLKQIFVRDPNGVMVELNIRGERAAV